MRSGLRLCQCGITCRCPCPPSNSGSRGDRRTAPRPRYAGCWLLGGGAAASQGDEVCGRRNGTGKGTRGISRARHYSSPPLGLSPVLVYPASAWSGRGEPRTGKSASEWYATRQREGGRISSPRGPHACTVPVSFYGPYRPTVPLIHYSFIFFSVLYLHERSRVFFFAAWSRGGLDAVVVTA